MSISYINESNARLYSNFNAQNEYQSDIFIQFKDVPATLKDDMVELQTLLLKTSLSPTENARLTDLRIEFTDMMPTAIQWNQFCGCLVNMQVFIRDNVVGFFNTAQANFNTYISQFTQVGNWTGTNAYYKFNIVFYNKNSYIAKDDNVNQQPDINPSHWQLLAFQGEKGDPGVNINYKGQYSSSVNYVLGDAVSYDNVVYWAKQVTIGNPPTDSNYWQVLDNIIVSKTEPVNRSLIWLDTSLNAPKLKYYDSNFPGWLLMDAGSLNGKTASENLNTQEKTDLAKAINEILNMINIINSRPQVYVQATDPVENTGVTIKTYDVWMDVTSGSEIIKVRMSDGTWKPFGAVYK